MKYIKQIITLFFAASTLYSCTYRIDITTDEGQSYLVIYGHISTDTTRHYIHIHKASGYFAEYKPEGVSDAIVVIRSGNRVFHLAEDPENSGWYWTDDGVYGIEGETYTLSVITPEDGVEYEAVSYLPFKTRMDSIKVQEAKFFTDKLEILSWGQMPDEEDTFLSFHAFRNEEPLTDSLRHFMLVDCKFIKEKEIKGVPSLFLDQEEEQFRVFDGDSITLRVNMLTKEYGMFLEHARMEAEGSVPIFSGPPANVPSNIKAINNRDAAPVFGFFTAYSGDYASTIYVE